VHREGSLCVGDEIVNVNGRRLRGLTMAGARDALGSGPRDVDLVIARLHEQEDSAPPRPAVRRESAMPETSVDYENILIVSSTADTPAEEHVFECPSPASKVISKRQHFQKNGKAFRRAIVSQGETADSRTGAWTSHSRTRCKPEDLNLNVHCYENLKPRTKYEGVSKNFWTESITK